MLDTTTRAADLEGLNAILTGQRAQRHDVIQPAAYFRAHDDGTVSVHGDQPFIHDQGITMSPRYTAGEVFQDGVSQRLGIPRRYVRKMYEGDRKLWATNVNAWLQSEEQRGASFMLRTLRDEETGHGFARALLSDKFPITMENLDVLVAALAGVHEAGHEAEVTRADLTERKMYVTLKAPEVNVEAAELLRNYRSPFEDDEINARRFLTPQMAAEIKRHGDAQGTAAGEGNHRGFYQEGTEPIVHGGVEITNSDLGYGLYQVRPKLHILRCTNGMTVPMSMTEKVLKRRHIGARQDSGVVQASAATVAAQLAAITAETRDAVAHFMSEAFVAQILDELAAAAGHPLKDPAETIKVVTKELSFTDEVRVDVLSHFMASGVRNAGGVMQAFTSAAQTTADGDTAARLEDTAIRALELAVANA